LSLHGPLVSVFATCAFYSVHGTEGSTFRDASSPGVHWLSPKIILIVQDVRPFTKFGEFFTGKRFIYG